VQENKPLVILERFSDVEPHINSAITWANSDRNALGFLPALVFTEQARKGNLLVATMKGREGHFEYAGHLLFDARQSKAKILQVFVKPEARQKSTARRMLDRLKEHLTELHFISIYANVAEDLSEANAFWERNGFYIQRTRPGGKTRNRVILVRCHELNTPQLFERSGISLSNPFGLDIRYQGEKPIYLLDLNVLFDLRPRRPRNKATLDLFRAERHGACQLALSAELKSELTRTAAVAPHSDPMHTWAAIFITFPLPPDREKAKLIDTIGAIVFPEQKRTGRYSTNDLSDLTHLATAVHHRLAGFITNDAAILAMGKEIESVFNIHISSPHLFEPSDDWAREELSETSGVGETLAVCPMSIEREWELRQMLLRLGISDSEVVSDWGAVDTSERSLQRLIVLTKNGRLAGYLASRRRINESFISGRLAVDESASEAEAVGRLLLNKLLSRTRNLTPGQLYLQLAPKQVVARELAAGLGFFGRESSSTLFKLALNRIVSPDNWHETISELDSLAQFKLPNVCPTFNNIDQQVEVMCPDGNRRYVSLYDLESGFSPALFCLPGRPAVITPIQKVFALPLLEHSPQGSLLPRARATQYSERHYLSAEKTLKFFVRGTIMLFYESGKNGGSKSIVAIARVRNAYLKPEDAINRADFDPSVLNVETLSSIGRSKSKTVTVFDNLILLPKPVAMNDLIEMGCGKPYQLLSTRPITFEQLNKILNKALFP